MRILKILGLSVPLIAMMCGGLTRFSVKESSRAVIPGASILENLAGGLGFGEFANMHISQSQEFQNQGVTENQIHSVKVKSLMLRIVRPDGQDFSFLSSLEFFVEAEGLPKRRIASGKDFAPGLVEIGLDVEDVELKPYVVKESVNVSTDAAGQRPQQETEVEAEIVLEVDVDVKGAVCGG